MKIVINTCFGGFGLSALACEMLSELTGHKVSRYDYCEEDERTAPELVAVVETLGGVKASDTYAALKVVEVPDDVKWYIDDYDGVETVEEVHRSWS